MDKTNISNAERSSDAALLGRAREMMENPDRYERRVRSEWITMECRGLLERRRQTIETTSWLRKMKALTRKTDKSFRQELQDPKRREWARRAFPDWDIDWFLVPPDKKREFAHEENLKEGSRRHLHCLLQPLEKLPRPNLPPPNHKREKYR